jgi:hypothetical protein
MLLTFGAIELGIGFSQKGGIEAAARAGARKAATLTGAPDVLGAPGGNDLIAQTVDAVNAALDSSAIPELTALYIYDKVRSPDPHVCGGSACVKILPDAAKTTFDASTASGQFLLGERDACKPLPDRVTVRIEGSFHFLSGLVGSGTIGITGETTLQFEPTNCS